MKKRSSFFLNQQQGSMLVELLMSLAIAAMVMPFIFKYQYNAAMRAENISITKNMENIQSALERYIVDNRENLLKTVGRNITRVNISDLINYGVSPDLVAESGDKYQLRVLKSSDIDDKATLQGVIVFSSEDITPLRTREIVALGDDSMGFIEGNRAYGNFGAWRTDTVDLGVSVSGGIVETTSVNRDNALYLWRLPSENAADATMLSALNLSGHDITNVSFLNASATQFDETLNVGVAVAKDVIFQNKVTLDNVFESTNVTVSGILSSDSRNMEVSEKFSLADTAKFSNFTTGDLWVANMTLGGLSTYTDEDPTILRVNKSIDMTSGRIDAMYVTVGFTGSITPRLVVNYRIEDSTNPSYFWDASYGTANMKDIIFEDLNRMAELAVYSENDNKTETGKIFSSVAANENATVSDYMIAIQEIQNKVRAKYRLLNLE